MARLSRDQAPPAVRRAVADPGPIQADALGYPAMLSAVPAWRALAEQAVTCNVLAGPDFSLPALEQLGPPARGTLALAWEDDERRKLAGALLVTPHPSLPGARAVTFGDFEGFGPIGTPLLEGRAATQAAGTLLDAVSRATGATLLVLRGIEEESPAALALRTAIASSGRRRVVLDQHERAALATTLSGEDYLKASLSSKKRKELRRQLNRLRDELGSVEFAMHGADSIEAGFDTYAAIEDAGWKGRHGTSLRQIKRHDAFLRDAVKRLASVGNARIGVLRAGQTPVAAAIVLQNGRTASYLKTTYDESLSRCSPGVQITLDLTRALADDPGIDLVDSTALPDHAMIDHLWRERLRIADWLIELKPNDPAFRVAATFEIGRRRLRGVARKIVHKIREIRR
jgi:CelD/BcsL family acetyltransferase involved in cellulose biosynthesis